MSLALATRTGPQCHEFTLHCAISSILVCRGLRSWEVSNVVETGTFGGLGARIAGLPLTVLAALTVAIGLPAGDARATVDLAAKVNVELVARPGSASGSAQDFSVRDGGVLRSGDGVQLRLRSETDAYVYVIAYGSSNTAVLLHPFSAVGDDALIRRGQEAIIPEAGVFLPLDGREGRETLFTIISDVPLPGIPELLPRIEAHGGDLNAITTLIEKSFPLAERLTFKHIAATPLVGVAATVPRSPASPQPPSPAADPKGADGNASAVVGASLLPPASSGWSVPSSQDFGTGGATTAGAAPAAAAASANAGSGKSTSAAPVAVGTTAGDAAGSVQTSAASVIPASSALREAREAAGIDESQFRGILATLPDSNRAVVPDTLRKPFKEQGVLSAEGSRIRALERAGLESDQSWPGDDGGSPKNLQN